MTDQEKSIAKVFCLWEKRDCETCRAKNICKVQAQEALMIAKKEGKG